MYVFTSDHWSGLEGGASSGGVSALSGSHDLWCSLLLQHLLQLSDNGRPLLALHQRLHQQGVPLLRTVDVLPCKERGRNKAHSYVCNEQQSCFRAIYAAAVPYDVSTKRSLSTAEYKVLSQ